MNLENSVNPLVNPVFLYSKVPFLNKNTLVMLFRQIKSFIKVRLAFVFVCQTF